jgi:membrane protein insertase Oxa1/YidC/SpoIIIJ
MRVVSIPLTIMQQRNAAKLHLAKPEIEALNRQVAAAQNDQAKLAEHQTKIWVGLALFTMLLVSCSQNTS